MCDRIDTEPSFCRFRTNVKKIKISVRDTHSYTHKRERERVRVTSHLNAKNVPNHYSLLYNVWNDRKLFFKVFLSSLDGKPKLVRLSSLLTGGAILCVCVFFIFLGEGEACVCSSSFFFHIILIKILKYITKKYHKLILSIIYQSITKI